MRAELLELVALGGGGGGRGTDSEVFAAEMVALSSSIWDSRAAILDFLWFLFWFGLSFELFRLEPEVSIWS